VFICGGAEIGPALIRRARRALGTRVVRTYGSTEFPTFSLGDPYGDEAIGADTDGLPVPLSSYRLDQSGWSASPATGELLVRGAELFLGYHDQTLNQDAFDEDGYFRTGDLVRFDDNGACAVVGRKKDIIIRGGENLSAIEIEDLLLQHPAVRDVAVVAMPDPDLGERVCAFVVAATPGARLDSDEVRSFIVGSGLAVQKSPERVELLDELPRTASGKVQKYLLREKIRAIVIAEAEQAQAANQAPRPS
jgi:cyclohexanecarboxylate-CoA ligase